MTTYYLVYEEPLFGGPNLRLFTDPTKAKLYQSSLLGDVEYQSDDSIPAQLIQFTLEETTDKVYLVTFLDHFGGHKKALLPSEELAIQYGETTNIIVNNNSYTDVYGYSPDQKLYLVFEFNVKTQEMTYPSVFTHIYG